MRSELEAGMADVAAASRRVAALLEGVSRTRPPDRRPTITSMIDGGGIRAHATIGYDPETFAPIEIFLRPSSGARAGSMMDMLCDDISVLLSLMLQHGMRPEAILPSLGRFPEGGAATTLGAALAHIAEARP